MSDSQDELLSRPAAKQTSAADPEAVGQTPTPIPTLDQIVQQSKQKDLADLLIRIIQTNEAEENSVLKNYDADVSSATLRDIDAKLSAVLEEESDPGPAPAAAQETVGNGIPMLTEVAEFPVDETSILEFPTASSNTAVSQSENHASDDAPIFEFPATAQVGGETAAANSGNAPVSANQDSVSNAEIFEAMDEAMDEAVEGAAGGTLGEAVDAPTWDLSDEVATELASSIASSEQEKIEQLVEQHTERVRAQLDFQIEKMKHKLLAELLETSKKDA